MENNQKYIDKNDRLALLLQCKKTPELKIRLG